MPDSPLSTLAVYACSGMALLWVVQTVRRNATIVDVGWGAGMVAAAWLFAWTQDGLPERRCLVAILGGAWALRLTYHLAVDRVAKKWHEEDGRYAHMRQSMGKFSGLGFFIFFQLQAGFVLLFALPLLPPTAAQRPLDAWDILGLFIGMVAIAGEYLADRQLAAFRRNPENAGRTCQTGLWRYSRHPNYFFECTYWWAWIPISWGADNWWLSVTGPVSIYLFIMYVTGIPHTERQAASHRADYEEYRQRTNRLIPGPPRSPS